MVLFVGQIARGHCDREAFQELDYRAVFGGLTKWVAELDATERLPEYVARAFRVAMSGRPGPVVLALPEDMQGAEAEVVDSTGCTGAFTVPVRLDPASFKPILKKFATAERPLVVTGRLHATQESAADLARFAERTRRRPPNKNAGLAIEIADIMRSEGHRQAFVPVEIWQSPARCRQPVARDRHKPVRIVG